MNETKINLYESLLLIRFNIYNDLYTPAAINEKINYLIGLNENLFNTGITTSKQTNKNQILKGLINHTIQEYKTRILNI